MLNYRELAADLREARGEIYSFGTEDLTCQLGEAAMGVGVYKIQRFLNHFGEDREDVVVVFGPDGTITRNRERFENGVGYGCALSTKKYIFPTLLRPNACGFGFFRIKDEVDGEALIRSHLKLVREGIPTDGGREEWDIYRSNHFIDLLRLMEVREPYREEYDWLKEGLYALIHSSPQNPKKKLYHWQSEGTIKVKTPLGIITGLCGREATEYLRFFDKCERISKRKRSAIAEGLFGKENIEMISNPTHQGYFVEDGRFVMRLGIFNSRDQTSPNGESLFPLGFNAYSPVFLCEGRPNIEERFWTVGEMQRAEEHGQKDVVSDINILPHGGGYKLNYPYSKVDYKIYDGRVFYRLGHPSLKGSSLIREPTYLEYCYRDPNDILPLVRRFGLGNEVAIFKPHKILKI